MDKHLHIISNINSTLAGMTLTMIKNDKQHNSITSIRVMTGKETLESCRRFVMDALKGSKFSEKDKRYIVLAVDEALTHICDYSLGMSDPHEVGLELQVDDVRFLARISDSRTDFSGLMSADARDEAWRDLAGKRQMGVFLIRQIVDEVRYSFRRGFENELTLLKFVP